MFSDPSEDQHRVRRARGEFLPELGPCPAMPFLSLGEFIIYPFRHLDLMTLQPYDLTEYSADFSRAASGVPSSRSSPSRCSSVEGIIQWKLFLSTSQLSR